MLEHQTSEKRQTNARAALLDTTVELVIFQIPGLPSLASFFDGVESRLAVNVSDDLALSFHDL